MLLLLSSRDYKDCSALTSQKYNGHTKFPAHEPSSAIFVSREDGKNMVALPTLDYIEGPGSSVGFRAKDITGIAGRLQENDIIWLRDPQQTASSSHLSFLDGRLVVMEGHRALLVDGESTYLSTKEFDVTLSLAKNAGRLMTREALYSECWDTDFIGESRALEVQIHSIRSKMGHYRWVLATRRGSGYIWDENNPDGAITESPAN